MGTKHHALQITVCTYLHFCRFPAAQRHNSKLKQKHRLSFGCIRAGLGWDRIAVSSPASAAGYPPAAVGCHLTACRV